MSDGLLCPFNHSPSCKWWRIMENGVFQHATAASTKQTTPCPSPSHVCHVTVFHTCLSGQPHHRFWHWLSTGPDHRKHADHRLLLRVPGEQRSLQELLHSLRWGFRNIVGWLEARNPRGSGHECLWVAQNLDCFIGMLSGMIKPLNSLPAFQGHS